MPRRAHCTVGEIQDVQLSILSPLDDANPQPIAPFGQDVTVERIQRDQPEVIGVMDDKSMGFRRPIQHLGIVRRKLRIIRTMRQGLTQLPWHIASGALGLVATRPQMVRVYPKKDTRDLYVAWTMRRTRRGLREDDGEYSPIHHPDAGAALLARIISRERHPRQFHLVAHGKQ